MKELHFFSFFSLCLGAFVANNGFSFKLLVFDETFSPERNLTIWAAVFDVINTGFIMVCR